MVGFLYFNAGFNFSRFLFADCLHVAIYTLFIYMTKACHETPSQYISSDTLEKSRNSRLDKSTGALIESAFEKPNITFIQERKKKVGPSKYRNTRRNIDNKGNKSKKKLKNKNSDTKNIEPGNPKKIRLFRRVIRKSFGHIKLIPLISVSKRVLKRLAIASTNKKELVDRSA